MLLLCYLLVILNCLMIRAFALTPNEIEAQRSGWNANPKTQYHIQTDDGLERYFKFQTLNGQFRKEKRLEDGTVIGTEGWLDPSGYLRIKDYMADHNGFRIIRSKTIFVGKHQPISDAISISKRVPSQSGTFIKTVRPPNPFRQSTLREVSDNGVERNADPRTQQQQRYMQSTPLIDNHNYFSSSSNLPPFVNSQSESAFHGFHRKPFSNYQRVYGNSVRPSFEIEPPLDDIYQNSFQKSHSKIYSPENTHYLHKLYSNQTTEQRRNRPNNRYEIDRYDDLNKRAQHIKFPLAVAEQKLPEYDGTYTVADGFQYYLKTHYHEEEQKPDHNIGSFGYIDPFGIRRVIYYKADRNNGFLHKKNNRYVGSAATPYDPVPLKSV